MKTKANNETERLRAQLIEAGVPDTVVDYSISQGPSNGIFSAHLLSYIGLFILGAGVLGFVLGFVQTFVERNAAAFAENADGVLFVVSSWSFFIAGLPACAFAAMIATYRIALVFRRNRVSMFVYTITQDGDYVFFRKKKLIEQLKDEHDPERYIRASIQNWLSVDKWAFLILAAVTIFMVTRELSYYTVISHEGYTITAYLPGFASTEGTWSDAQRLELACIRRSDDDGGSNVKYTIHLYDTTTLDLGEASPVSGTWLDHVETIDQALRQADVPAQRWGSPGRESPHSTCMRELKDAHSPEDYQRLLKILRVGAFPSAPSID